MFLWCVLLAFCACAGAQQPSHCPQILKYEPRGKDEIDKWTATMTLTTLEELHGVWLNLELDRPANSLLNWFGDSKTTDNTRFTIRNSNYVLEPGAPVVVKVQVLYTATEIAPSLVRIRLNGRTICSRGSAPATTEAPKPSVSQQGSTRTRTTASTARPTTTQRPVGIVIPGLTERPLRTVTESSGGSGEFFSGDLTLLLSQPSNTRRPGVSASVPCGTVARRGNALITNGKPSVEGDWPWHIALYTSDTLQLRYICGGSLINRNYALTAAHCVARPSTNRASEADGFLIHLGRTNLRKFGKGTQERRIDQIFIHPNYNYTYFHNDLAVLKLSSPVEFNDFVRPVCLNDNGPNIIGKLGTVVGWGFDQFHQISEALQETQMPVVDSLTCIYSNPDFFNKFTSKSTYCAGFKNGTSVCNGDSGGGMYFSNDDIRNPVWEIRGLVSVSLALQRKYCDPFNYVVFTDLKSHMNWIRQQITDP